VYYGGAVLRVSYLPWGIRIGAAIICDVIPRGTPRTCA